MQMVSLKTALSDRLRIEKLESWKAEKGNKEKREEERERVRKSAG